VCSSDLLHLAVKTCNADSVRLLLKAAPATAMAVRAGVDECVPLHYAALQSREAVVDALLEAAPAAVMVADEGWLPLQYAAWAGHAAAVRSLVQAAPQTADITVHGQIALQVALTRGHVDAARHLVSFGAPPAGLDAMSAALYFALPLFADLLLAPGRLPLSDANWRKVPSPCPSIERVLPAALACGPSQAAQVVCRLPPADKARLRTVLPTAVLCLGRHGLPAEVGVQVASYVLCL